MKYFENHKRKLFPEITDWSDPQNKYRFDENIKAMPYKYFFFFSPYNYKLVMFGLPLVSIIIFGSIGTYFYFHRNYLILAICILVFIHQGGKLKEKIKHREITREMNFYDLWMREEK